MISVLFKSIFNLNPSTYLNSKQLLLVVTLVSERDKENDKNYSNKQKNPAYNPVHTFATFLLVLLSLFNILVGSHRILVCFFNVLVNLFKVFSLFVNLGIDLFGDRVDVVHQVFNVV